MKKFLTLLLIIPSLVISIVFLCLYKKESIKEKDAPSLVNSYFLSPISFDFSQPVAVVYPKINRPIDEVDYLREVLSEGKWRDSEGNNWEFLLNKRIIILQKYLKAEIVGNYKNVDQLVQWYKEVRPKSWEFWKFKDCESWEANLAQYYLIFNNEIDFLKNNIGDEAEKTETVKRLLGIMLTHKKDLDWVFKDWPLSDDEKIYLRKMRDDIFEELSGESRTILSVSDDGKLYYSVLPIISSQNFGKYNLWFETAWHDGKERFVEAEIWGNFLPVLKRFTVLDRYGLSVGQITITGETKQLAIKIKPPENLNYSEPPRLLLKKAPDDVSHNLSDDINFKTVNFKRLYLLGFVIFFALFSIISFVYLKNYYFVLKHFCLKRVNFKKEILLSKLSKVAERQNSFVLITIYIAGVFFKWRDWDFLAVLTFFFWTGMSFFWNFNVMISLIIALFLMIASLVMMKVTIQNTFETLSIYSYFFIFSFVLQASFEGFRKKIFGNNKNSLIGDIVNTLFLTTVAIFFLLVSIKLLKEVLFYKDYFGKDFAKNFYSIFWIRFVVLWGSGIILLKILISVLNKISFVRKITASSGISLKILLLTILFAAFWRLDTKLYDYIRRPFENNPYIIYVNPAKGTQGSIIEITGHSFREEGSVILNGANQKIISWKDKNIVFELTDEFSDSGLLKVVNSFDGETLESNSTMFTFIDTSPPAEKELDL